MATQRGPKPAKATAATTKRSQSTAARAGTMPAARARKPTYAGPWLSTEDAAAYLSCSVSKLVKYRATGGGPPFEPFGDRSFRYPRDGLDAFMRGELSA